FCSEFNCVCLKWFLVTLIKFDWLLGKVGLALLPGASPPVAWLFIQFSSDRRSTSLQPRPCFVATTSTESTAPAFGGRNMIHRPSPYSFSTALILAYLISERLSGRTSLVCIRLFLTTTC